MLHYNFPPFSVGEVKFLRGPGRREIGHGALAERALRDMLPPEEDFPYTIRIVSDILESNGSSSMASVCGGTLALMDAGVPLQEPGRRRRHGPRQGRRQATRSCPTSSATRTTTATWTSRSPAPRTGITALQMDIKIGGITAEIMAEALEQAREGRLHILERDGRGARRAAHRRSARTRRASSRSRSRSTRSATSSGRAAR